VRTKLKVIGILVSIILARRIWSYNIEISSTNICLCLGCLGCVVIKYFPG